MNQNFETFRKAVNENPTIQQQALEITGQDVGQFYQEMAEDDELSDFELEMVAAGSGAGGGGGAMGGNYCEQASQVP